MKASLKTLAAHLADTTPSSDEANRVLSYMGLRVSVGVVGFALPIVLFTSHFFFGSHHLPGSISAFYYTPMRNYFVGTLFALGVLLFSYRYAPRDNVLSGLASFLIVFVALCPTAPRNSPLSGWNAAHLITAALFFATLAFFSYFLFTRTNHPNPAEGSRISPGNRKRLRNKIYKGCGITIAMALVIAAVFAVLRSICCSGGSPSRSLRSRSRGW